MDQQQRSPSPAAKGRTPNALKDLAQAEKDLRGGYDLILKESELLSLEVSAVLHLLKTELPGHEDAVHNLHEISQGRIGSVVGNDPPPPARRVAWQLKEVDPADQQAFVTDDFKSLVKWASSKDPSPSADELRERVLRRKQVLDALLPPSLEPLTAAAIAHVERRFPQRRHDKDETT